MSELHATTALRGSSAIAPTIGAGMNYQASQNQSSQSPTFCEAIRMSSNGFTDRTVIGHRRQTPHADGKQQNQDWIAAQVASRPVQHIVDATGMSEKGVQNVRRRKSKLSFDSLVDLCRSDPAFAAAFAEYVGLIRPGEAEFAGALTTAFNAYQRRNNQGDHHGL